MVFLAQLTHLYCTREALKCAYGIWLVKSNNTHIYLVRAGPQGSGPARAFSLFLVAFVQVLWLLRIGWCSTKKTENTPCLTLTALPVPLTRHTGEVALLGHTGHTVTNGVLGVSVL